jgi:orotate phosphoribosyltransferase
MGAWEMSEAGTAQILLERLIATGGFAVRNHKQEDAFWYTSGNPGPFYINTENIAGAQTAEAALNKITHMLKAGLSTAQIAKTVVALINDAVANDAEYRRSIEAITEFYRSHRTYEPIAISGGERRDWFFSIPVAARLKLPHIFLFKSGHYHVTDYEGDSTELELRDRNVVHVADIINASSYLERWIPILKTTGAIFTETLTVAVRNSDGVQNLRKHNISVVSPLLVDLPLFAEAHRLGLISPFAYDEISRFYASPKDWTRSFLAEGNIQTSTNMTKQTRIEQFKQTDPYGLKSEFPAFFS